VLLFDQKFEMAAKDAILHVKFEIYVKFPLKWVATSFFHQKFKMAARDEEFRVDSENDSQNGVPVRHFEFLVKKTMLHLILKQISRRFRKWQLKWRPQPPFWIFS